MKKLLLFLILLLLNLIVNSQTSQNGYTYYPGAAAATGTQLRFKNCLAIDAFGNKWGGLSASRLGQI
jgi:hypothetical protein